MKQTIRVRAGVAIIKDGKILLVPHRSRSNLNIKWYLPGGGIEYGERLKDAAAREASEETGLQVEIGQLIDVSESVLPEEPWHSVTVTFASKIIGGSLAAESHRTFGEL